MLKAAGQHDSGVIVAPPGTGKTVMGLELVARKKQNTLIIVHRKQLLDQWVERIQAFLISHVNKKRIFIKKTALAVPFNYRIDDYSILSKILIFDTSRNGQVISDITDRIKDGRRGLILTERKEHIDVLYHYLKEKYEIITISGDDPGSLQKTKMAQLKQGHYGLVISTGQFFGEGMDISGLDSLFLVYPFSFEGKLIQYIGRIERSEGEKVIFDYRDINIDYFEKFYKNRKRYYKKLVKQGLVKLEET